NPIRTKRRTRAGLLKLSFSLCCPTTTHFTPMATTVMPRGCGSSVGSLYHNLCDLDTVWGVVVEAFAAAGIIFSFVLFISLLASLPFVKNPNHRNSVGVQSIFLICTTGLFGLTFAFIVGEDYSTCASRQFLFGVLFGGCFSCLLMQCVTLNILVRNNSGPQGWILCLGVLGLWLVEVIINTEATAIPCNIANQDFVMALIYVMTLILAVVVASLTIMGGKFSEWKKEGALILVISLFTVAIWLAWIVMYVYGNKRTGGPTWNDPTLAIALVANAWVFLVAYIIPQICCLNSEEEDEEHYDENTYSNQGVGYETILKEQSSHNMYMENKAFSMDEPTYGGDQLTVPFISSLKHTKLPPKMAIGQMIQSQKQSLITCTSVVVPLGILMFEHGVCFGQIIS
uniref:G protein-coupled receptor, class C, group 5, member C n=1 Tax=Nothobranchius furzeri TaxID=105023 RepID=A0A8C6Q8H9_NOTFU